MTCNDKGLVTNYGEGGGATKREGGHVKFYPYEKGGGGAESFHPLKGGREKFYPVLRGGAKSFGPVIFPFCSPLLPVINDQSLNVKGRHVFRVL